MQKLTFIAIIILCTSLITTSSAAQDIHRPQPEIATGTSKQSKATAQNFMAVTANPYATKAAYKILKKGGSAVDAAIAAQLVLGLVEPQSSGLGGGGFALVYDAKEQKLRSYDGREIAPARADSKLFLENAEPLSYKDAVIGGRAVGVPGLPMLLSHMHDQHGLIPWAQTITPALELAKTGFIVSPRLAKMIEARKEDLNNHPPSQAYFFPAGQALKAGDTLINKDYAKTLNSYAQSGAKIFYDGDIAKNIIEAVQNYASNPGLLAGEDFKSYSIKERPPICGPYREYIVCGMGEPSSGGLTILQALGMLEHFDLSAQNAQSWHIIAQASTLAFADRNHYMADSDFVKTPGMALLAPEYLKTRAALITPDAPLKEITHGTPKGWDENTNRTGDTLDRPGTTHISIIDQYGNAVSLTSSIEYAFGSQMMVNGFLLNNQLTDFSFSPTDENNADIANRVEPHKRPRSSMSPTIVFDQNGAPVLILGSAGGSRIINHVLQRIIAVIDWDMPIDKALSAPHILSRDGTIEMETEELKAALESKSNKVEIKDITSGLTAIHIKNNRINAAADPRREGLAMGD